MKAKKFLLSTSLLMVVCLTCGMASSTLSDSANVQVSSVSQSTDQLPPVTYDITDTTIVRNADGSFKCRIYELMVTNHTSTTKYVTGAVHEKGDPNKVSGHFAGNVSPGKTKSLYHTIDTPFYVVEWDYEDSLY